MIYLGIDPGKVNLGAAILDFSGPAPRLLHCSAYNPAEEGMLNFTDDLLRLIPQHNVAQVVMERYVPYDGVLSPDTERITMFIGAIAYGVHLKGKALTLVRAVDWKTSLSKKLFRIKNFRNPSTSLDKKFSIAAAKCCLDLSAESTAPFQTDHEADAICLASLPFYLR